MKIVQRMGHYPPFKWWYESHGQERWYNRQKFWYGEIAVVTSQEKQPISHGSYDDNGVKVFVLPSFELISNFPFPKFRTKNFRTTLDELKKRNPDLVVTRTRFFLTSFYGWLRAKSQKKLRIHIDHGSDFVKLSNPRFSRFAWLYDQTFGRWIFRNADKLSAISQWPKKFMQKFSKREIPVIHRGLDLPEIIFNKPQTDIPNIVFVGRMVTLKWGDLLVRSLHECKKLGQKFHCTMVGDGPQKSERENLSRELGLQEEIMFVGEKNRDDIMQNYLAKAHIAVNPSFQEWLPTSVLEWLFAGCVVVATDVGGTREISEKNDLILVQPWNLTDLTEKILLACKNFPQRMNNSHDLVRERFSRPSAIKKYHENFSNRLAERNGRM